jgi:hypothetical protein
MVYVVSKDGRPIKVFWTKTELSEYLDVSRGTVISKLEGGQGVIGDYLVTELHLSEKKRRKFR